MREEERRLDVAGYLTQVAVVPGRLDAPKDGWGVGFGAIPADAETVAVGRLDAEACVEALIDQGVIGLEEQLIEEDR